MSARPGQVCGTFFAMTNTIGTTGNNTALKFNVREVITSVSRKTILRSDASTLRDFDKLS